MEIKVSRLTIHLENAMFIERSRRNIGTEKQPIYKPKKSKCIRNTLSFKDVSETDINRIVADIRKKFGIKKGTKGAFKGKELIYIVK